MQGWVGVSDTVRITALVVMSVKVRICLRDRPVRCMFGLGVVFGLVLAAKIVLGAGADRGLTQDFDSRFNLTKMRSSLRLIIFRFKTAELSCSGIVCLFHKRPHHNTVNIRNRHKSVICYDYV